MVSSVLVVFVDLFIRIFYVLLLVRVVMSWVAAPSNRLLSWLMSVTEPILAPIRRLIPQTPGLDLAPLVAIVVLQLVQMFMRAAFAGL